MTTLQQEILTSFENLGDDHQEMARAAAEVAKKYTRKAWNEAKSKGFHGEAYYSSFDDYAKDSGISE